MRVLIQIVSLFFIVIGLIAMIRMAWPMFPGMAEYGVSDTVVIALVGAVGPGAMVIIFGSVSYMLCSIDMRLEELVNRPPPTVTVAAPGQTQPATFSRDHDLF
jgi:hypothetical protein